MATDSATKGKDLEKAVKFIQHAILNADRQAKGVEFSIATNVRDKSSGVLHEIDVLVKTQPESDYQATFIFECKNWEKPVDKNVVIILSRKVDALGATRGFLVAKSISKEAEAQIAQEKRLKFIRFTKDFWSPLNNMELVHSATELMPIAIMLKQRNIPPKADLEMTDWKETKFQLNGTTLNFPEFIKEHVDHCVADEHKKNESLYRNEGGHWGQSHSLVTFDRQGEFMAGDKDIEYMVLTVAFIVTTQKRKLLSKFELEGKGQVFFFEPIGNFVDGKQLEIQLVKLF